MPDAGSALDRPFVQELLRRVRPVASRRLGVALALVGTAGSGKTWSARELVRRAPCASLEVRGARVAVEPRAAWQGWVDRRGRCPALERAVAGEPVGPEPLSEAIAGVLAAATPILVLVDDAHEADPGGAELLERLARRIHRMPGVALVLTSRGEAPAAATKVDVPPLDEAETRNVVTALLEAEPPEQAVSWTHRHAHGNPLFTIEYVRLLAQAGYLWNDLERWRWRPAPDGLLPVTVEGVLERRIADAGLLPAERAALEALALLHETGVADAWAQTAGLSERALGAAALGSSGHGLVRAAEFRHPLLAQVVVRTTPPTRRREHARRAVEALRAHAPEAVAAVALAAALDAAETVDLLGRAAEAARERGDARTAASWWSRAAERADGPQRARFASLAGRALLAVDPEASVPHLEGRVSRRAGRRRATLAPGRSPRAGGQARGDARGTKARRTRGRRACCLARAPPAVRRRRTRRGARALAPAPGRSTARAGRRGVRRCLRVDGSRRAGSGDGARREGWPPSTRPSTGPACSRSARPFTTTAANTPSPTSSSPAPWRPSKRCRTRLPRAPRTCGAIARSTGCSPARIARRCRLRGGPGGLRRSGRQRPVRADAGDGERGARRAR